MLVEKIRRSKGKKGEKRKRNDKKRNKKVFPDDVSCPSYQRQIKNIMTYIKSDDCYAMSLSFWAQIY